MVQSILGIARCIDNGPIEALFWRSSLKHYTSSGNEEKGYIMEKKV